VVTILRPARTPKGTEVRTVIKHAAKRTMKQWPRTRIASTRRQPLPPRRGDGID
jgi:hypothetical protein